MKIVLNIEPGDKWCIVYDWHQTADSIRAECERLNAFKDVSGSRFYLVEFHGFKNWPFGNRIGNTDVIAVTTGDLDYLCGEIHEVLREKTN